MGEIRISGNAAANAASAAQSAAGSINADAMVSFAGALSQVFPNAAGNQGHHGGGGGDDPSTPTNNGTIDTLANTLVQLDNTDNVIEMVMTSLNQKSGVQELELKAQKDAFDMTNTELKNQIAIQSYFASGSTNPDGVNVNEASDPPLTITDPTTGDSITFPYTDSSGNTVTVLDYEQQTYGITPPTTSDGKVSESDCGTFESSVSGVVQELNNTSTEQQQELQETVSDYQNTNSLMSTLQSDLKSILQTITQHT